MEQLAVPQRLADGMGVVEPGHLLVADFGVDADQLGVLQLGDERQRVPGGRQQDVAARLVRLGLDREPQRVSVVNDVLGQHVERFLVPLERGPHVLAAPRLRAFPAAPAHVHPGPQLGRQVDIADRLGQREPADVPVICGERALLEDRAAEQVRRGRRHDQAGVGQRRRNAEICLSRSARSRRSRTRRCRGNSPRRRRARRACGRPVSRYRRADRGTEDVDPLPAHGPDTERETVSGRRRVPVCGHGHRSFLSARTGRPRPRTTLPCATPRSAPARVAVARRNSAVRAAAAVWRLRRAGQCPRGLPRGAERTYSCGSGTSTSAPKIPGASAQTASERAPRR